MSRHPGRASQAGLSLAEVLVGMAAGTIVMVSALTMLDYGRRVADTQDDVLTVGELSRAGVNYVTTLLRQAETGTKASSPINCLSCHVDTDGALVNNPATNCPNDMTIPQPPIRVETFNVDPNNPTTRTVANPGNGIWFDVDRTTAPTGLAGAVAGERRSFYPQVQTGQRFMLLQEQDDHNRDGTPEGTGPVIYGMQASQFTIIRAPAPTWTVGQSVTPACSSNPAGCHGTGNTNLTSEDIYGNGTWTATGSPGSVWAFNHPDSHSIRGVEIQITAASRGRTTGGQAQDFTRTLRVLATPRRLQQ